MKPKKPLAGPDKRHLGELSTIKHKGQVAK
ncbi:hypothetical protein LBUL_0141 [Lactobacillus delbrueckii subsp. bulgaricus ATCC BAA-365]|nr:hypothetical protein LBUL_0141 [Lactobacillus delbrueckii subsp. bulgaricus ATCC BAA-365]